MISIIVPVYKVEKYLPQCIDSILAQTFRDIELILVDDGSPDNCGDICDEYARKDDRIKVIHKKNGGLSDARNAGIDVASGEYLGFVDSDDFIAPDMYERLYRDLTENDADVACCLSCNVYDDDMTYRECKTGDTQRFCGEDILTALYTKKLNNFAWNKLYKRELFENIRYPYGKIYEDLFTTYKIFGSCKTVVINKSQMYYYRVRKDSIMGKARRVINIDKFEAFAEIEEYLKDRKNILGTAKCYMENDLMSDVFKVISSNATEQNKAFFDKLTMYQRTHKSTSKAGITIWLAAHMLWVLKARFRLQKLFGGIK